MTGPGGPPAVPDTAFAMRSNDIVGLSEALRADAAQFSKAAKKIIGELGAEESSADWPWGADDRNAPAFETMRLHREYAGEGKEFMQRMVTTMNRLGDSAQALVATFGDQDRLNAAKLDEADDIIPPTPSHGTEMVAWTETT